MSDPEVNGSKMTPLARNALGVLVVSCVALTALEFVIHRHAYFETEGVRCFLLFTGSPHF